MIKVKRMIVLACLCALLSGCDWFVRTSIAERDAELVSDCYYAVVNETGTVYDCYVANEKNKIYQRECRAKMARIRTNK